MAVYINFEVDNSPKAAKKEDFSASVPEKEKGAINGGIFKRELFETILKEILSGN